MRVFLLRYHRRVAGAASSALLQPEKDEFLDIFYMNFMGALVGALGNVDKEDPASATAVGSGGTAAAAGCAVASGGAGSIVGGGADSAGGIGAVSPREAEEATRLKSQFKAPINSAARVHICELVRHRICINSFLLLT